MLLSLLVPLKWIIFGNPTQFYVATDQLNDKMSQHVRGRTHRLHFIYFPDNNDSEMKKTFAFSNIFTWHLCVVF